MQKKASAQNRAKALKIMRFWRLLASQGGLFHLPENTFLKKVLQKCCKSVAKVVVQKVPNPETRINTGFFGTSKPKETIPTRRCRGVWRLYRKLRGLRVLPRL